MKTVFGNNDLMLDTLTRFFVLKTHSSVEDIFCLRLIYYLFLGLDKQIKI
jgi:hypothetical protein